MNEPGIPERLKAARKAAKLSVRKVAEVLGMPPSTYQHYEKDYKKAYLPPDMAQVLATLFANHGVAPTDVLALGGIEQQAVERLGLRENEVVEYRTAPHAVNGDATRIEAALTALAPDRPHASLWQCKGRALELAGYRPGDMLVADLEAEAKAGDVVVAQLYDWTVGSARTVLRIFQPPYLVAAAADPVKYRPELVDNERVVVKAVVVASFRIAHAAA